MSQVITKYGPIVGEKIFVKGCTNPVNRYLGIPYAKAPVGQLRFRKPAPLNSKWKEPFKATEWPPQCPQFVLTPFNSASEKYFKNKNYSEDCLKLNVWSPDVQVSPDQKPVLKPVLVWIHGGGLDCLKSITFTY